MNISKIIDTPSRVNSPVDDSQVLINRIIITDNIDIWTSALKKRSATGRGSNKKIELTGIKKLRELILELAVRGKLVPQDPNDEPASVLLEKIAAEKEQLVKDKKIKKIKALPVVGENDIPFELPNGWAIAFIPQVVSYDKYAIKRGPFGSALKKAYFVPNGIKIYEQQHAIKDDFSLGEYYITEEKFNELRAFQVKPNDLIISCSGTVGKVAIAPIWMKQGIINQALLKITLNENVLTNSYFKILFPAFYMKTETLSDLQGTAQKNMVSVDTLKSEPFPLPSITEQHRIVAKVDELMLLCDQLEQQTEGSITAHQTLVETLLATLSNSETPAEFNQNWTRIAAHFDTLFTTEHSIDQLKQTILQLAVMGKLVPQNPNDEPASVLLEKIAAEKEQLIKDKKIKKQKPLPAITEDEKPFELPSGWEWTRLGIVTETGPRNKLDDDVQVSFVPMPLITTNHDGSHGQEIRKWSEIKKGYTHFSNGDIALAKITPCFENSKAAVFSGLKNGYGAGTTELHVARPFGETLNRLFVLLYLKAPQFLQVGKTKMTGSAGQKRVPTNFFAGNPMPFPPLEQQHRIVKKVNELMTLCDQLKNRINDAQTSQLNLADAVVKQAVY